jgi:hypothetical protein
MAKHTYTVESESFEFSNANLSLVEKVFEILLASVTEGDVTEQKILSLLREYTKVWKRLEDNPSVTYLAGTIIGRVFRVSLFFDREADILYKAVWDVNKDMLIEARSYARAIEMQMAEEPTSGIKTQWRKGLLGLHQKFVTKVYVYPPRQIDVLFRVGYKNHFVTFSIKPLG